MIRFAVCDDERFMLDEITVQLSLYMNNAGIAYQAESFKSGMELLQSRQKFDVIFLDIQMESLDGMETAGRLREMGCESLIVFITILRECVFDSFDVNAYDYLVKPLEPERLKHTMDRIIKTLRRRDEKHIVVKNNGLYQVVSVADLVYCEVIGRKVYLHQKTGGVISYYERLEVLEHDMDGRFFRCHRSYLVNLDYVRGCQSGRVFLITGEEVPVSRLKIQEFTQALLNHMKERRHR